MDAVVYELNLIRVTLQVISVFAGLGSALLMVIAGLMWRRRGVLMKAPERELAEKIKAKTGIEVVQWAKDQHKRGEVFAESEGKIIEAEYQVFLLDVRPTAPIFDRIKTMKRKVPAVASWHPEYMMWGMSEVKVSYAGKSPMDETHHFEVKIIKVSGKGLKEFSL